MKSKKFKGFVLGIILGGICFLFSQFGTSNVNLSDNEYTKNRSINTTEEEPTIKVSHKKLITLVDFSPAVLGAKDFRATPSSDLEFDNVEN